MKNIILGITAHVDSGKTTLAEALLHETGVIQHIGRVDKGNSFLDTNSIERDRGITIFASQAELTHGNTHFTLLDTPGHVDFSAETERTMQVLDYAILVISGTDGVQSHTATLWKLLQRYEVPVFIFVNKMDLTGADKLHVLNSIRSRLSNDIADFSDAVELAENAAAGDEELMEEFLETDTLSDESISRAISQRRIFPCFFGSALKEQGIAEFLNALDKYTIAGEYSDEFGAKVYKISYDSKGSRLTHMKIMGGSLKVRSELEYLSNEGEKINEKISSLRFYSAEKFRTADTAYAGEVCTVTGLENTYSGQGIGCIPNSERAFLEPVMTYQIILPESKNVFDALKEMRRLEDEDPQLHIVWNEQLRQIHIQLMGAVQLEVLSRLIFDRFGYEVTFGSGAVAYKETIAETVEGMGHYEPLRHYAEVHLILEPLPRGSGLVFDTAVSEDDLALNWQRLILTHLEEKEHIGTLTGSPITDMKITICAGKAHLKHTEGGDFRQATYRAVRHGLRNVENILLEPFYDYELEIPMENTGRALADLQRMSADFSSPETAGEMAVIRGSAPVAEMNDYISEVVGYTRGKGRLTCINGGYRECHNAGEIIEKIGYNCDSDVENTADSVFCSHGAGMNIKWDEAAEYMHLPSMIQRAAEETENPVKVRRHSTSKAASEEELMEIFEMTYGKIDKEPRNVFKSAKVKKDYSKPVKLPNYEGPDYLLVDGYNIIFAWDELKKISETNLDAARAELIKILSNYQGWCGYEIIIVFDAYKVKGKHREVERHFNVNVVYTKESETADSYIERVTHELSGKHRVRVATSDGVEQLIILGSGAMRMTARELKKRIEDANSEIRDMINR